MTTPDITRNAFDPRKDYRGVILQQGRVLVEDDLNDLERARLADLLDDRTAIVGSGSPNEGYRISGPLSTAGGRIDFTIRAGDFYAAGMRLRLHQDATFQLQASDVQRVAASTAVPAGARRDLAWLEAWEQEAAAIEDGELVDPGVGVDTAARVVQLARVQVRPNIGTSDCAGALAALASELAAAGRGTLDSEGRLTADARLAVGFVPGAPSDNPCDMPALNGFRGPDNTLIRVQVSGTGLLTWGFENGSSWHRAQLIDGGTRIRLLTEPRDRLRWPLAGQHLELVPWGSLLPNGEKLAAAEGSTFATCVGSYDPTARTIALAAPVAMTFGRGWTARSDQASIPQPLLPASEREFIYVRLWERGVDAAPAQIPFVVGTPVALGATGLTVTLSGTQFPLGGHWLIAARPSTPERVTPWALLGGAAMRVPPRRIVPLAIIAWSSATFGAIEHDCRRTFLPLTRLGGCCTITVGDGLHSHGRFTRIQDAIDALPPEGGKVCVLTGTYTEDVLLVIRKNVTIEGCGARTKLQPATATGAAIRVLGGANLTIAKLAIDAPAGFGVVAIAASVNWPLPPAINALVPASAVATMAFSGMTDGDRQLTVTDCDVRVRDAAAIAVFGWNILNIRNCRVLATELLTTFGTAGVGTWKALHLDAEDVVIEDTTVMTAPVQRLVAAPLGGIHLLGGCARVRIDDCRIDGGAGDGITFGQVVYVPAAPVAVAGGTATSGTANWTYGYGIGYTVTPNGCIAIDPDPETPDAPDGTPLRPISVGDLYDITVSDTVITGMGGAGIGVVRFFNRDVSDEMIAVHGLTVTRCRIIGNLRAELPEMPPTLRDDAAYAAIALAAVDRFAVRESVIEGNGTSHVQAICGIFVLLGEDVRLVGNRIADNAPTEETQRDAEPGIRGGIVLAMVLAPARLISSLFGPLLRQSGAAACELQGNTVIQPFGQALVIIALGPVIVANNRLVSRGARDAKLDLAALFAAEDLAWQLLTLAASTVAIINFGTSNEYFLQLLLNSAVYDPGEDATRNPIPFGALAADGNVRFHGNQVDLDLIDNRSINVLSSMLFFSLDDVAIQDNQCDAELLFDGLFTHLLALAWTLRIADNRVKEPILGGLLSGIGFGFSMNATTGNQSTHCILAYSGESAGLAEDNNRVTVHLNGKGNECADDAAKAFQYLISLFT